MTTNVAGEKEEKTTVVAPAEGADKAPPAATPPAKVEAKPEAKKEPVVEAKKEPKVAETVTEQRAVKRVVVKDDDEEIPDDAELIEMTSRGLKSRITRAKKAELRERFGTDDVEAIAKDLAELKESREKKEEARKAALTAQEKEKERADAAEARATAAEARAKEVEEDRQIEKVDASLTTMALKHVKEKFWRRKDGRDGAVLTELRDHLSATYSKKELKGLKDSVIEKWMKEFVKENPEYALAPAEPEAEKKLLTNGGNTNDKPAPNQVNGSNKTYKVGQPNSMTPAEAKASMAQEGYRY